jgi:predicted small lipoprotein YifL
MKKILKQLLLVLTAIAVLGLAGCKEKGPMEKAGKAVDKAAEKTGDAIKEAADETKDAVENK